MNNSPWITLQFCPFVNKVIIFIISKSIIFSRAQLSTWSTLPSLNILVKLELFMADFYVKLNTTTEPCSIRTLTNIQYSYTLQHIH